MIWLLVYFIIGVIEDFIGTMTLRFVITDRIWLATITTFVVTVISLVVFYSILVKMMEDSDNGIIAIVVYSLGISIGNFIAMKMKLRRDKNGKLS